MKLCDLETSKALQELGYNGEYNCWIDKDDGTIEKDSYYLYDWHIPCPRLDDAAYWLRDRIGVYIYLHYVPSSRKWIAYWEDMYGFYEQLTSMRYEVGECYDDALEGALKGTIAIIKKHSHAI